MLVQEEGTNQITDWEKLSLQNDYHHHHHQKVIWTDYICHEKLEAVDYCKYSWWYRRKKEA